MCTGKGDVERELLSLRSRERGVLIQGSLCLPLKSGGFFGTFVCTGKGYVERELLSLRLRERWVLIQGSLSSPLKSGVFFGTFVCTGKGYVERETFLALLEREGGTYSGLALLASQKWWFFWHFCVHLVESSKGLVGPLSLRSRGPITIISNCDLIGAGSLWLDLSPVSHSACQARQRQPSQA